MPTSPLIPNKSAPCHPQIAVKGKLYEHVRNHHRRRAGHHCGRTSALAALMRTKPQLRTKDIGVEANSYPFVPQDEWTYGVDYVHDWVHTKRGPVWMLIRRRQP